MNAQTTDTYSLGKHKTSLRPKRENLIAGYSGVLLLGGVGISFILTASGRFDPMPSYVGGGALLVGAAGFLWYVRTLSRLSVHIHEHGFIVRRGADKEVFAWNLIERVEEHQRVETIPPLKDIAGVALKKISGKTAYSYSVVRKDGRLFYFDNNVVPRASLLAGPLRTAQRAHNFPWNVESR